jgi:7-cyano-7-deazaguanine synthase
VELKARRQVLRGMTRLDAGWAARLGPDHRMNIRAFGAIGETALTSARAIEVTERGLPSTFVPGRNLVFLTYAAALADRRGLKALVGGMCETDFSGYPDCRRDTLDALQTALNLGMAQTFRIETPLMRLTKSQTWALAKGLGGEALVALTLKDSHTCYLGDRTPHPWGHGCGQCPACRLRASGWETWTAEGRPALTP